MGQQHRVRVKRKRRHAYLDRKKVAQSAKRRGSSKPKAAKKAATASADS